MKKNKSTSVIEELSKEIIQKIKDLRRKIRKTKKATLFGINYKTFFTSISEILEEGEVKNFFLSNNIRFLGEVLLEDIDAYIDYRVLPFREKIIQIQKSKRISPRAAQKYSLIRKRFWRLGVEEVFGKEIPSRVAILLDISMGTDNPLQIGKNCYRNFFVIQKNEKKEQLASLYRMLHLHAFWRFALEQKNNN